MFFSIIFFTLAILIAISDTTLKKIINKNKVYKEILKDKIGDFKAVFNLEECKKRDAKYS